MQMNKWKLIHFNYLSWLVEISENECDGNPFATPSL